MLTGKRGSSTVIKRECLLLTASRVVIVYGEFQNDAFSVK